MDKAVDSKYVVVSVPDVIDCCETNGAWLLAWYRKHRIEDAVVIRTQDVFAMSGLFAYANSIQTHVELLGAMVRDDPVRYAGVEAMVKRLTEIADYFVNRAVEAELNWRDGKVKVPD